RPARPSFPRSSRPGRPRGVPAPGLPWAPRDPARTTRRRGLAGRSGIRSSADMKAILLAGGQGSRLRPLTLNTPKPIVPIFDRPFLRYQIELLKQVPEIDEIVLSLNYQPRRIEEVFADGADLGVTIRYVVEPQPLGTGGAIKFAAGPSPSGPVVVFNGDVLTSVDLPAVIALHRE